MGIGGIHGYKSTVSTKITPKLGFLRASACWMETIRNDLGLPYVVEGVTDCLTLRFALMLVEIRLELMFGFVGVE